MAAQDRPRANGESLPRVEEVDSPGCDNGIEAADRGDFATEEEVRAVFALA